MNSVICFHNPAEENGYLSNWYLCSFTVGGISFSSMEQYMMYRKAAVFHDAKTAEEILRTQDPAYIKKLGRQVAGYEESDWNGLRQIAVYNGLTEKFLQNADLKKMLIHTGDATLAECAVKDLIWGIGLSMQDPNRFDKTKWSGQNLLGYTLMAVREDLR